MKVLLVNITGRSGSTGKIVSDIRESLIEYGHEAIIAYGHADTVAESGYYQIGKRWEGALALRLMRLGRSCYKGNPFAFSRLKKLIEEYQPDVVHLHCINCQCINIYKLLKYLASVRQKTVITHHAEFFYTGSCPHSFSCTLFSSSRCVGCVSSKSATGNNIFANPHRNWGRMFNAVNNFKREDLIFTAVSPWSRERAGLSPIVDRYRSVVVFNGLDTDLFHYRTNTGDTLAMSEIKGKKIILHVTPFFDPSDEHNNKGGYYVVEVAKQNPEYSFIIVSKVSQHIDNLPDNVLYLGEANSQEEMANLYSLSDVLLLTSKRETFSMVTAESLCCGTPVVGFKSGGPESIAISQYCCFVDYADTKRLSESLRKILSNTPNKEVVSKTAISVYSRQKMVKDYLNVYELLINANRL